VSIGANATIVCGVTLGDFAFVWAGAVVKDDVKPYVLVVGVPAKQVGWMSAFGETLQFDEQGMATCSGSGQQYQLKDGQVKLVS